MLYVSVGVLFDSAFSIWVSIIYWRKCVCLWKYSFQWTQTSLRRLQDVLKRSWRLTTKTDNVKTSCRRHSIYGVLKMSDLRRLEDTLFTTFWSRLIYDVLKTSDLRRPGDVWFMSSWRRPINDVLKTFNLWRLEDVCKTTSL